MIRILIADDHALLREGLKLVLADEFTDARFGEAGTATETLQFLRKQAWDVLILDINLPGRSGLDVLRETRRDFVQLPVLVLSSTPEDQLAVRVLKAGASGYLNKQIAAEELVNAVRKVMSGGLYVSPGLAEKLAEEIGREQDRPPHELLSDREFQIFKMMTAGKSVTEIAAELSRSVKTISTFRGRVFDKLRLHNNMELYQYAHRHGLLESDPSGTNPAN
jgi:DNA-binding NarL/FixJ family response regulator